MEIIVFLSIVIAVVAVLTSIVLVRRVKKQIAEMTDVLVDVKNGNGNRRILSATNELTAPLAYEINEIVVSYESRLSTVRQTEETNRQLMTSLSHDVRTPLTTLIGYLDAAHKGLVTGKDRDDYIETARRKAHDLKEYIDVLFDWFKLNSNEFALEIQSVEAAELTRNIRSFPNCKQNCPTSGSITLTGYPAISLPLGGNTRTMQPLSADGWLTIPLKLPRKGAYPITATRREKVYETSF